MQCGHVYRHTTLSCQVSCRYPRTHAVWGVIFHRRKPTPTPSLAHCNRYQLSQNTSVLPLPASPLSDRFSHPPLYPLLYFSFLSSACVTSLSVLIFLFSLFFPSSPHIYACQHIFPRHALLQRTSSLSIIIYDPYVQHSCAERHFNEIFTCSTCCKVVYPDLFILCMWPVPAVLMSTLVLSNLPASFWHQTRHPCCVLQHVAACACHL